MLKEKFCPHCETYFFYETEVDTHGVSMSYVDNRVKDGKKDITSGYCPRCVDPHRIPGMTYKKKTILSYFRNHLVERGVQVQYLDDETLIQMLTKFPTAHQLYTSNSTYLTFTLVPDLLFNGKYGEYKLGQLKVTPSKTRHAMSTYREIICLRCNKTTIASVMLTLYYYLGMKEKQCKKCDYSMYVQGKKPSNISGLNRNGSKPSEYSDRALAKALNVSRNDFRRHLIHIPEPPLPVDTIINGLRIDEAFWCDKTQAPRYILVCDKCQDEFNCLQKRAYLLQHTCQPRG